MAESGKKWYVMRAVSGKEGKVKEYIELLIAQHPDIARHVSQVLIPTEKTFHHCLKFLNRRFYQTEKLK